MKLFKKILFALLIVFVCFALLLILPALNSNISSPLTPTHQSIYETFDYSKQSEKIPTQTESRLKQSAWIPDWAFAAGYKTLTENWQYLDSVSPVYYYLEADGKVRANKVELAKLQNFCRSHNIDLIPSISNFDSDQLTVVLSDPDKLKDHIAYLENEVGQNNFDGIDIDYESIMLSDQGAYLQLLHELHSFLQPQHKKLTVAVMPKWTNDQAYTVSRQTRKVQDWALMEPDVDEFRIMTYDYTSQSALIPGPIAPLDWQEAVVGYAKRYIPADKIMLGANLYAYVWEDLGNSPDTYLSYIENLDKRDKPATALTINQINDRLHNYRIATLNDASGELTFTYRKDGKFWRAYAPSIENNRQRIQIAQRLGIRGIAYWRLGDEDATLLQLIK